MKAVVASNDEADAAALPSPSGMVDMAGQRVVWNKATGEFDLQPAPVATPSSLRTNAKRDDNGVPSESLEAALNSFTIEFVKHEASSFQHFRSTRSELSQRILASDSPMRWLPRFVSQWSGLLALFSDTEISRDDAGALSLCEELLEIAQTLKALGDIEQARAHLGKCIALARRQQQQQRDSTATGADSALDRAKKVLFECIHFQEALTKCQSLLLRTESPPQIVALLLREMELLSSQAPFSVELLTIKTQLLWRTHQNAAIVSCLSASSLTDLDPQLTLLYARALEAVGSCQQSLSAASKWRSDDTIPAALCAHRERLGLLLATKSSAEQLQRSEKHQEAALCYSECLHLLGSSCNRTFHASLLLNRANMTLMLVTGATAAGDASLLSAAIDDLTQSLKLDPSSQLAKVRLDTALLQRETEKLKLRMGIK